MFNNKVTKVSSTQDAAMLIVFLCTCATAIGAVFWFAVEQSLGGWGSAFLQAFSFTLTSFVMLKLGSWNKSKGYMKEKLVRHAVKLIRVI